MSKSAALQTAILELLESGSGSASQIRQQLETAGAAFSYGAVTTALQALQRLGKAVRSVDGVYERAKNPAPPANEVPVQSKAPESAMATKTCPSCHKTKPEADFVKNGKCRECNRAYMARYRKPGAKPRKAKTAAKAPRPKPARANGDDGLVVVEQITSIAITDVDGKAHHLKINAAQVAALREALAGP